MSGRSITNAHRASRYDTTCKVTTNERIRTPDLPSSFRYGAAPMDAVGVVSGGPQPNATGAAFQSVRPAYQAPPAPSSLSHSTCSASASSPVPTYQAPVAASKRGPTIVCSQRTPVASDAHRFFSVASTRYKAPEPDAPPAAVGPTSSNHRAVVETCTRFVPAEAYLTNHQTATSSSISADMPQKAGPVKRPRSQDDELDSELQGYHVAPASALSQQDSRPTVSRYVAPKSNEHLVYRQADVANVVPPARYIPPVTSETRSSHFRHLPSSQTASQAPAASKPSLYEGLNVSEIISTAARIAGQDRFHRHSPQQSIPSFSSSSASFRPTVETRTRTELFPSTPASAATTSHPFSSSNNATEPLRDIQRQRCLCVFDTSSLIAAAEHDYLARFHRLIELHRVCIAKAVIQELDGMIKLRDKRGGAVVPRNRQESSDKLVARALAVRNWITNSHDRFCDDVLLQGSSDMDLGFLSTATNNDDHILGYGVFLAKSQRRMPVVFVTEDQILTIKAKSEKLQTTSIRALMAATHLLEDPKSRR